MNDDDEADEELFKTIEQERRERKGKERTADEGLHVRAGEGDIFVVSGENPN